MKRGPKPRGLISKTWSPKLAYAIGLITADGCLYKDGRHINFTSKDIDQIAAFKECLGIKNKVGIKKSGTGSKAHYIQFGDVLFFRFLLEIGLKPSKSKTLEKIVLPEQYFPEFLRGYFDGDGCSYSYYDPTYPKSFRFYVSLLLQVQNLLIGCGNIFIRLLVL